MLTIPDFLKSWQLIPSKMRAGLALLAVSGGGDSMVMATLFADAGLPFAIAHCNFSLRGEHSDGDEQLVKEFAILHNIPFHHMRFDTGFISAQEKKGIQEVARNLRYQWLNEVAADNKYSCICTAHHQDDVAETVLMNLARGTGIAGLHGIKAVNGKIVRPLLGFSKADLTGFASGKGVAFREDSSNNTDDYTRNAIRHHVLPALEKYMAGAASRIAETAIRVGEAEILYQRGLQAEQKGLLQVRGKDYYIPLRLLKHRVPLATVMFELLQQFNFTAAQTPEVLKLMVAESGKQIASSTHMALRNRDFIIITRKETVAADVILIETLPKTVGTPEGTFTFLEDSMPDIISTEGDICFADASKIELPLLLRRWKTGDYFYPIGMKGKKKKLSRFFIDQKIPLHDKERIWVLESNRRIVWVCGMRMDERFKITASTKKVVRVELTTS